MSTIKTTEQKKNSTFSFIKDFGKVLVLDGREKVADKVHDLAEVIDTTQEQKQWSKAKKEEFEKLRQEKELAAAKTAGAKA